MIEDRDGERGGMNEGTKEVAKLKAEREREKIHFPIFHYIRFVKVVIL